VQLGVGAVNGDRERHLVVLQRPGLARADERAIGLHAQPQAHGLNPVQDLDHLRVQEGLAPGDLNRTQPDVLGFFKDAFQVRPRQVFVDLAAEDRVDPAVTAVQVTGAGDIEINLAQWRDAITERCHGLPPPGNDDNSHADWRG